MCVWIMAYGHQFPVIQQKTSRTTTAIIMFFISFLLEREGIYWSTHWLICSLLGLSREPSSGSNQKRGRENCPHTCNIGLEIWHVSAPDSCGLASKKKPAFHYEILIIISVLKDWFIFEAGWWEAPQLYKKVRERENNGPHWRER